MLNTPSVVTLKRCVDGCREGPLQVTLILFHCEHRMKVIVRDVCHCSRISDHVSVWRFQCAGAHFLLPVCVYVPPQRFLLLGELMILFRQILCHACTYEQVVFFNCLCFSQSLSQMKHLTCLYTLFLFRISHFNAVVSMVDVFSFLSALLKHNH